MTELLKTTPVIGPLIRHTRYKSNCYVACLGRRYQYRLFDDFGYDSCVVIREPQRFIERTRSCMEGVLPGWAFSASRVSYLDPCHPTPTDDVLFSKHFRFTYQQEFRMVWEAPTRKILGNARSSVESNGSLVTHSTTPFSAWQLRA
jgi:hypothetical protein